MPYGVSAGIERVRREKVQEAARLVGQIGKVPHGHHMWMNVKIMDVKYGWGKLRLFIRPVSGEGAAWINRDNVIMPDDRSLDPVKLRAMRQRLQELQRSSYHKVGEGEGGQQ